MADGNVRLFLGGDVMIGRGVDQILPHPGAPELHERWARSAGDYVALAERASGAEIPRPVAFDYVWGDALVELERQRPLLRLVNLETSITRSDAWERDKGIHYRMNPANLACLTVAGIDCCVLANNHVLDWGRAGLLDTLRALEDAGIARAGAGTDGAAATRPAALAAGRAGRLLVFACGIASSGIPAHWAAADHTPGVHWLPDASGPSVDRLIDAIRRQRGSRDLVLVSVHWGGNWGYRLDDAHVEMAHRLVDEADVHLVHGHSSHHPLAIEIYRNRAILYGCGDLLNDYEGIRGYEAFRGDLTAMYFPTLDASRGELAELVLAPMRIHRLRLERPSSDDVAWMAQRLIAQSRRFGVGVRVSDGRMHVTW